MAVAIFHDIRKFVSLLIVEVVRIQVIAGGACGPVLWQTSGGKFVFLSI